MKIVKHMLKKRVFAVISFLFMIISVGNVIANTDVDKSPSSVFLKYMDNVASGSLEEAYNMLSNRDKETFTLEEFKKRDSYYYLNSQTRSHFLKLFSIKIAGIDIVAQTAIIKYLNQGPHGLYMNAWKNVSRKNEDKVKDNNELNLTSKQFFAELNDEILKLIQEKNYHVSDEIKSIELIMEHAEWKINLDLDTKEKLRNAIILLRKTDDELGIKKHGGIASINSTVDEYQQIKDTLAGLKPIYEDDLKLKSKLLETLDKRIGGLGVKP